MSNPIRAVIVDGDGGFRRAVCEWLSGVNDIVVVGEARDGQEIFRWLRQVQPDVVLIDVDAVPAAQVREMAACAGVVVLHRDGQEILVLEAFRQGALGHLVRGQAGPEEIARAIRAVHRGEAVLSPALAGRILDEVVQGLRKR